MAERAAMYLIRMARVEAYEAAVGVSEETALLGRYIERLDRMLLRFLEALAVTRIRRKMLEGGEALSISVTDLLRSMAKKSKRTRAKRFRTTVRGRTVEVEIRTMDVYDEILEDWLRELEELKGGAKGRDG